jgi:GDP-4-dehydro-6-deoxy-D-mannose reductase
VLAASESNGAHAVPSTVDLLDLQAVRTEIRAARPDAVIHLAARHPATCPSIAEAVEVNVRMTAGLLDAMGAQAPGAVVLIAGSAAQYGFASAERLRESTPLAPVNAHGAIKTLLERLSTLEPLAPGLRIIATRSFNHVGPGQGPEAPIAGWVRQIAAAEREGGGTLVTGRLDVVRDFLDVRDVAQAYLALVKSGAPGVVNVCSGKGVRLREIIERLRTLATAPIDVREDAALFRGTDPEVVVGDPSRLADLTGWKPKILLDTSLRDALDEQRDALATPAIPRRRA